MSGMMREVEVKSGGSRAPCLPQHMPPATALDREAEVAVTGTLRPATIGGWAVIRLNGVGAGKKCLRRLKESVVAGMTMIGEGMGVGGMIERWTENMIGLLLPELIQVSFFLRTVITQFLDKKNPPILVHICGCLSSLNLKIQLTYQHSSNYMAEDLFLKFTGP